MELWILFAYCGMGTVRALAWVYDGAVEAGEADAVDGGETCGVEAEAGDVSCGGGIGAGEDIFAVEADGDLLLPDEHFNVVPGVDVEGEGREIGRTGVEEMIAELGVDLAAGAGAAG